MVPRKGAKGMEKREDSMENFPRGGHKILDPGHLERYEWLNKVKSHLEGDGFRFSRHIWHISYRVGESNSTLRVL